MIDGAPKTHDRISQLLLPSPPSLPLSAPIDLSGDIVVKDVSFSYPTRPDLKIFDGISLSVPANSVLAIVGSSGSG